MRTKLRSKFSLLFMVCAALLAFAGTAMALTSDPSGDTSGTTSPSPTIASDKDDYAPGELVTLTGSGWQPGESVNIKVNDDAGQTWSRNVNVTADESGNISDSFNLPEWFVAAYSVTATGSSGTATTSFTDARVVTSATLNGGSSVNVLPGGSITANVNVERSGSGNNAEWESTGWRVSTSAPGSVTCVDHADYTTNAPTPVTNSESFTITAPNANGTYNAYFIAYSDDACSTASGANAPSVTFTISNGVVVKTNQAALNYTGPTTGAFGDKLTLSSSGGSGTGAVTYEATGTACELGTGADAGKLLITSGTGTCFVEVKKAGDSNFNAATSGPQTITVNKAAGSVTINNIPNDATFGGSFTPAYTKAGTGRLRSRRLPHRTVRWTTLATSATSAPGPAP